MSNKVEDLRAELELMREEAKLAQRAERQKLIEDSEAMEVERLQAEVDRLRESMGGAPKPAPIAEKPPTPPAEQSADKKGDK